MSSQSEQSSSVTLRKMTPEQKRVFKVKYLQMLKDKGWPSGSDTESEDEGLEPELAVVGRGCRRHKKSRRLSYDATGCQVSK